MNKTIAEAREFAEALAEKKFENAEEVAILAPFTQLVTLGEVFKNTGIGFGAENVHFEPSGAYTGEISVPMLEEIGVDYCIVGHSERRGYFGETDGDCLKKIEKLAENGIAAILCVGENLDQRDAGKEKEIVEAQVKADLEGLTAENVSALTIAYEPIWAIGTGRTASPEQAEEMCAHIRDIISDLYGDAVACETTIQYGGSMKPGNATELMNMENIDGGLIGGASLKVDDFMGIINF